jgi:chemotaxis protein methyltransferase CheR
MQAHLDAVLAHLKRLRNIDLGEYRRGMLQRRITARMCRLRCDDPDEYLERLRSDTSECDQLIDAIAINVSSFFRDSMVWEIIGQTLLPDIIQRKQDSGSNEIRVWSAGCAAGEEAFSMAILIHQALLRNKAAEKFAPVRQSKRKRIPGKRPQSDEIGDWRLHIFGTDIDNNALEGAANGVYDRSRLEETKLGILDEYFTPQGQQYQIRPDIKQWVSFSRDDLTSPDRFAPRDSVFGTFDLVLCRNVLIYFSANLQNKVLDKLSKSLDSGGYLVLGKSESLDSNSRSKLAELDHRNRIFTKLG